MEQRGSRRRSLLIRHVNCRTRNKLEQLCALTGIFIRIEKLHAVVCK